MSETERVARGRIQLIDIKKLSKLETGFEILSEYRRESLRIRNMECCEDGCCEDGCPCCPDAEIECVRFYWSLLFFLTRFLSSSIFSTTRSTYSLETESRSFSMKKQILTTILIGFKIESKYFVHYCGYIDGNWMVGVHRRNRGFG